MVPPVTPGNKASLAIKIAVAIACIACVCMAPAAYAAKATGNFTKESIQAYEQQLSSGQIKQATFNPPKHTMRLTLKDGTHFHVLYQHGEEPKLRAALASKGVALPKVTKPHIDHKLRYIAAGVGVVVLILIAAGLVLVRRRRRAAMEY
jgi:ATP-dependent Zn protease